MRLHGLFYGAGVLASFLALAGLLIALKAAGNAVGWGFQLQSPVFVGLLALLFTALGLNLSGAFEFATAFQSGGGQPHSKPCRRTEPLAPDDPSLRQLRTSDFLRISTFGFRISTRQLPHAASEFTNVSPDITAPFPRSPPTIQSQ